MKWQRIHLKINIVVFRKNNNLEKDHIDLDLFDNSIISYEAKKDYISECEV